MYDDKERCEQNENKYNGPTIAMQDRSGRRGAQMSDETPDGTGEAIVMRHSTMSPITSMPRV
jgi:hypothetical protein